ncbi:MAG: glutaredoxin 3 [Pseudomonadota bacterium]
MNDKNHSVLVYLKPWCPYCSAAQSLLDQKGVSYETIDLTREPDRRAEMESRSGRATVPQIFIDERHIGGFDDLNALERKGELDALLA